MKKIAVINDISGIGRCSLTVALPILSCLGIQACPIPTAILSNQTGYDKFSYYDFTDNLSNYLDIWKSQKQSFNAIYSGFLGSEMQIDIVKKLIEEHKESLIIIDPIMGDNGELYSTYNENMCKSLVEIVKLADIITPNLTEAYILLNEDINLKNINLQDVKILAKKLSKIGPKIIIITGVIINKEIYNILYDKVNDNYYISKKHYFEVSYSGTGDIFISLFSGLVLNNISLEKALNFSTDFIYKCIKYTYGKNTDPKEGIHFEKFLNKICSL